MNNLKLIYGEINKINKRMSNLENKNDEKVDVESLIITNNILINVKIEKLSTRLHEIEKLSTRLRSIENQIEIINNEIKKKSIL